MDWGALGKKVAQAAPVLGSAMGPGGAAIGGIVASVFGVENNPDAIDRALESDPQSALKLREIEAENRRELNRMTLEAETARHRETNKTMRVEARAEDPYVRRWRPTFGYIMAASFALMILGIFVLIVSAPFADPKKITAAADMIQALSGVLITLFGVGLSVLGVNIRNRSRDKQVQQGQEPDPGLLSNLSQVAKRFGG